jgi:hypothetical protein
MIKGYIHSIIITKHRLVPSRSPKHTADKARKEFVVDYYTLNLKIDIINTTGSKLVTLKFKFFDEKKKCNNMMLHFEPVIKSKLEFPVITRQRREEITIRFNKISSLVE